MAYETKVILMLLAQTIVRSKTVKEAYQAVAIAASVEGVEFPSFEEFLAKVEGR